jgi:long-chain acyl-CoA synthetase
MKSYYKLPQLTQEVMDADGYFHTGDIGEMVNGKYLKITDRKKELFKTSGGKYVAPQVLENKFKESEFIEQIMIIGDGRNYVSALIVPNMVHLTKWCAEKKIVTANVENMVQHPMVLDLFDSIINTMNPQFNHVEQIKKFALLSKEWTIQSGELTPTLKLKRKILLLDYAVQIEQLYPTEK